MRVVLVGGTSNVGKSTVAPVVAARLGFEHVSTDGLGRHPGRPWATPEQVVPPHVVEHYRSLSSDELVDALLDHYERMQPRIEELVLAHSAAEVPGLVLEGSGVWPAHAARWSAPYTAAVWLSAEERVLSARMHASSGYDDLPPEDRALVDKFLARSLGYQTKMLEVVEELGLAHVDVSTSRSPEELAHEILSVAARLGCGDGDCRG